jgi:hypothetical protein
MAAGVRQDFGEAVDEGRRFVGKELMKDEDRVLAREVKEK